MQSKESNSIPEINNSIDAQTQDINILHDQPTEKAEFFNFHAYSQSITNIITNKKTGTPLVIGIFGDWGSGKTSLMQNIQKELVGKKSTTIWFNAWKYNTEDAIWRVLLTTILETLKNEKRKEKGNPDIEKELKALNDLQNSLYFEVKREELGSWKLYPGKVIKIIVNSILSEIPLIKSVIGVEKSGFNEFFEILQREKKLIKIKKVKFVEEFHDQFKYIIENYFDNRAVIFIDDLDRCNPEKVIDVLEALRLFLDVKGCFFILGIDRRVISRGIELKYKELKGNNIDDIISGDNYLEKIIQLEFFLPKISEEKVKDFIKEYSDLSEDYHDLIVKGIEGNPRKIKRILNFIQFQLNLSRTIPEIKKEIQILIDNKGARGEKIFEAMLIEWTIISSYYPDFMKDVIENGSLLLNMHNYFAGKYEGKELKDKKLEAYINNEKYDKLHGMITTFSNTFMSPILYEKDIKNLKSLIRNLSVTQGDISDFIFKQFSTDGQKHLSYIYMKNKQPTAETCKILVEGLNNIIKGDYMYKNDFFTNIELSEKTKKFIESKPQGNAILLANRLILDEAFPEEIDNFKEFDLNLKNIQLIIHLSGTVDIESIKKTSEEFKKKDGGKEKGLEAIGIDEVMQLIEDKEKESLKGKIMTGMDLSNKDLTHFDLTNVKLNGAIMTNTILKETILEGANLFHTNLQDADLEHANLRNAILTRAILTSAHLNYALLENAQLNNAELWHAELNGADLKGANLKEAVLYNAEMKSADFSGANLYNAGMMSAKMEGAIFTGADLRSCNLISAKFDKKTDFRGADIDSTTINNLGGSNWDQAQWSDDVLIKIKEKYS